MFLCFYFYLTKSLSLDDLMGHWQGTVFNNTDHKIDFTFSFLEKFPYLKTSLWISSENNYSISDISDAYLGSIKISENDPETISLSFHPPNDPEFYSLNLNQTYQKEKYIELSHLYVNHGIDKMKASIYYSSSNIILTLKLNEFSLITINAFHDLFPQIPMSQIKLLIICVLIGCFLGGVSILLFCLLCFGDKNFNTNTLSNKRHEKLKQS